MVVPTAVDNVHAAGRAGPIWGASVSSLLEEQWRQDEV
jgi:hypothetical protein